MSCGLLGSRDAVVVLVVCGNCGRCADGGTAFNAVISHPWATGAPRRSMLS